MVLNDFKEDIRRLCEAEEISQSELGVRMGLSRQVIDKRGKHAGMTEGFTEMLEALGYDIEVRYVKR